MSMEAGGRLGGCGMTLKSADNVAKVNDKIPLFVPA